MKYKENSVCIESFSSSILQGLCTIAWGWGQILVLYECGIFNTKGERNKSILTILLEYLLLLSWEKERTTFCLAFAYWSCWNQLHTFLLIHLPFKYMPNEAYKNPMGWFIGEHNTHILFQASGLFWIRYQVSGLFWVNAKLKQEMRK